MSTYDPIALGVTVGLDAIRADARGTRFTLLPGGRRPDALVPGRGHVYLHSSMQPAAPKPVLFDREDHSERPTLPTLVDLSLSVLASYFLAPTANPHDTSDPTRWASAQDAARIVAMWRAGGVPADECDPHGIPRPGAS